MRTILLTAGVVGLVLAPACKKASKAPAAETAPSAGQGAIAEPAPAATAPVPAPVAPAPAAPAPPSRDMAECPSAVAGAETTVVAGKGSVVVTVTAREKAAVAEIQKRAARLDAATGSAPGAGPSEMCPVVLADGRRKIERQKGGIKVTLTPKDAGTVGEVAAAVKQRAEAIAEARAADEAHDLDVPGEDEEPADEE
ncbi:MAG TPA: hypothetical protein VK698_24555 [Kofleriaceae bacterium]|nr:hypothetical protein [Kofleriaceae bacterium]